MPLNFLQTMALPEPFLIGLLAFVGLLTGAGLGHALMVGAALVCKHKPRIFEHVPLQRLRVPFYTVLPILCCFLAVRIDDPASMRDPIVQGIVKITTVGLIYWLALRLIDITSTAVGRHYDVSVKDNLRARRVHTQLTVV